jgi:chromosome segregation ATPase
MQARGSDEPEQSSRHALLEAEETQQSLITQLAEAQARSGKLQSEKANLENQLSNLYSTFQERSAQLAEAESRAQQAQQRAAQLETQLSAMGREQEGLRARGEAAEARACNLEAQLEALAAERQCLESAAKQHAAEVGGLRQAVQNAAAELERRVTEAGCEGKAAEARASGLQVEAEELREALAAARAHPHSTASGAERTADWDSEARLGGSDAMQANPLFSPAKGVASEEGPTAVPGPSTGQEVENFAALQAALQEKSQQLEAMQQQLQAAREDLRSSEAEFVQHRAEADSLRTELACATAKLEAVSESSDKGFAELKTQLAAAKREADAHDLAVKEAAAEMVRLQAALQNATASERDAADVAAGKDEESVASSGSPLRMQQLLEKADARVQELQQRLGDLEEWQAAAQAEARDLQEALSRAGNRLCAAEAAAEQARAESRGLQERLSAAEQRTAQAREELERWRGQAREEQAEGSRARSDAEDARSAAERLRQELQELQEEHSRLKVSCGDQKRLFHHFSVRKPTFSPTQR